MAVRHPGGERVLEELRWGYIPEWAANKPGAKRLINARCETVHQKPSFRAAFRERRCVIPLSGWFEWKPEATGKQPYWLRSEGSEIFSVAGVWEPGSGTPGSIGTFVILTMAAAPAIADIHHRQPLILDKEAMGEWLRPGAPAADLVTRARKGCGSVYERRPVSGLVNSPRNDTPELLKPAPGMATVPGDGVAQRALV